MKVRVEMEMDVEVGELFTNENFKHNQAIVYRLLRIDKDRRKVLLQMALDLRYHEPFLVSFERFLTIYKKQKEVTK